MLNTATAATFVAALAAATGVAHAGVNSTPRDTVAKAIRNLASAQMRRAQVELYCDHPAGALVAIRRAVRQLELPSEVTAGEELATLERAVWHVRRNETGAAVAALDVAMTRLAA